jgi:hypothetical protein
MGYAQTSKRGIGPLQTIGWAPSGARPLKGTVFATGLSESVSSLPESIECSSSTRTIPLTSQGFLGTATLIHPPNPINALRCGPAVVAKLIKAGLVRAKTERVFTGHGRVRVTRVRITHAGRAALMLCRTHDKVLPKTSKGHLALKPALPPAPGGCRHQINKPD